ncbi:MAG: ABC transporter permease [Thermodesulfobacteriota bacterium]
MMTAIYILWLRQIKRYFRSRSRIIASLGQPLLFMLGLGFGFGPIYQRALGGSYIEYIGPGVIAMGIIFTAMFSGIEIIWDRQFGFLKETLVAPVSRFEIMIGRTLGGATVALFQGVIIFALAVLVGFRPTALQALPIAFSFMALLALFFTAFGTAVASLMEDMQAFPLIMNFLVMPMFFLSGAIFPIKGVPSSIIFLAKINPLSYGVDGIRAALIGESYLGLSNDYLVLSAVSLVLLIIGSYLFSKIEI